MNHELVSLFCYDKKDERFYFFENLNCRWIENVHLLNFDSRQVPKIFKEIVCRVGVNELSCLFIFPLIFLATSRVYRSVSSRREEKGKNDSR